jgi:ribosomal protein S12 methylthiotransferase
MGCAKNTVDSERLLAQLRRNDVELAGAIEDADVAIVNTCGFIQAAKEESIDMLIESVRRKGQGRLKKVYAMGCLTERYREDIAREIPELDGVFGSQELEEVLRAVGGRLRRELLGERSLTTPSHFAYLKISEGCDNPCSFCAIPLMRGHHVSVPMADLLQEARMLAGLGVKELVVIGQDTTYYGLDLDGRRRLAELLRAVADVPGIEWVRLMYAFPAKFPLDVLDVLAEHPRLCRYMDMPIQHASDPMLRSMRRGITARALRELLDTVRARVPGIALRTTLITGYPGETEEDFRVLLEFIREQRFARLGVFTYSPEEGTAAGPLGDPVPADVKAERLRLLMETQQEISAARNEEMVGSVQRVIVDREEDGRYVGRTAADAPEIDNEVWITSGQPLRPGTFHNVEILDATEYDLEGRPV